MSLLERTRQIVPAPALDAGQPWRRTLMSAGFGAVGALALTLLLVIPTIAAWLTDAEGTDSWVAALALAPTLWVLAHRGSVGVPGDDVAVTAPLLGLTIAALLFARAAARAAIAALEDDGEQPWWHVPAAYVGGYAGTGVVLALVAWIGPARPNPLYVIPGAIIVGALGMLLALLRARRADDGLWAGGVLDRIGERLPPVLLRALRPGLLGAAVLLALGALVVLAAVGSSWSRVTEVSSELGVGVTGAVVLWLAQLLALPNLAAWSAAWLSGAAVEVGPVTVGHAAVSPGVLPMVPVLGALPEAGAGPVWAPLAPLIPLVVGVLVGPLALRELTALASLGVKVRTAAVAGLLSGAIVLALGFLGALGVSGGTMSYVGPHLMAVPMLLVELLVGAVLSATVLHYLRTHR